MKDNADCIHDDIAFLRSIAEGNNKYLAHNGAILIAIGAVFGLGVLRIWAIEASLIAWPTPLRPLIPWDMIAVFLVSLVVINRRYSYVDGGPAGRAFTAAWAGVGWGISVAVLALVVAGSRLDQPFLVPNVFPIVLLALYGSAWLVAFWMLRRARYAALAVASYVVGIGCGIWMGAPTQWLVLGVGTILCAGLPGVLLWRQAKAAGE